MSFRCLFHLHTRHSLDSMMAPAKILRVARDSGVGLLIVTDHNTIRGSQEVRRLAAGNPLHVPMAAEYQTEKGDIIGVFLKEEIRSRRSDEVLSQVHAQGGLAVLPHPYKAHKLDDALLAQVDLIETYNARCSPADNASATALAAKLGKPTIGGADAHCAPELPAVFNEFSVALPQDEFSLAEVLLRVPRRIESRRVSAVHRPYSQMIKAVKTRNPVLFLWQSKRLATTWIREQWGNGS